MNLSKNEMEISETDGDAAAGPWRLLRSGIVRSRFLIGSRIPFPIGGSGSRFPIP